MSPRLALVLRLCVLCLLVVVVQHAGVAQISIVGVSADLIPLVVMSVGLLAGSGVGAVTGFAVGLFVDLAFVQTVGVSSLLYLAIGYGSGRLRELRDPSHGLVPLAAGAVATAVALLGFSVIQFLLGVEIPVSFLLLRQVLATILINTLLALPVYALVRRIVTPSLPADPLRRRRPRTGYPAGGVSGLGRASR